MINKALHIQDTTLKGKGIFTKKNLPADLIVETAPVIVMTDTERKLLDQTLLHDYIFEWQATDDAPLACCMALGWVPLYNHSYAANCEYFMKYDDNTIYIKTARPISAGDELTINYNGDWNNEAPVWFDAVND